MEKPGFPTPPPAGGCGRAQPASRDAGKPGFPITSPHGRAQPTSRGRGETRFPHAPARGRVREGCALPGTTVYSFPFVYGGAAWTTGGRTAWFRGRHISRPCGSAAQRRNEHKVILGRATPSQTLPRAGVWGSPAVIAGVGLARPARGAGAWGNPVSLYPLRESQARPRAGRGETRFPYTPA